MNQQTVEWICFVIGGILILTAVLTSIFKINIGGASVEGQSHWTQKIIAFFAGWVFVIIGAVFHGVALSNIPDGSSTQTSPQQASQSSRPTYQDSAASSDSSNGSTSPSPTRVREQPRVTDVGGLWRESASFLMQIYQSGNTLSLSVVNADGVQVGNGTGSVNGDRVALNYTLVLGIIGNCDLRISDDASQMSGSCSSNAGDGPAPATLMKIR